MRALIIEDSIKIRESLSQALREAGWAVDGVADGSAGLSRAKSDDFDAIVLDLGLPGMDGLEVLRQLRANASRTPVLVLTARDAVEDRVVGLRTGADDYVLKPFSLTEVIARLQALVRRSRQMPWPVVRVGPLAVDTVARTASVEPGGPLELLPREFALLEYLAHRTGRPVNRSELEAHLYDDRSRVQSNAVDSAVCALRAKLDAAGCPPLIHTRRKLGYVLSETAP